jgi:hypothetical protein
MPVCRNPDSTSETVHFELAIGLGHLTWETTTIVEVQSLVPLALI